MKKILLLLFAVVFLDSCGTMQQQNPYSVLGSWDFVDIDIDVKSDLPITDRVIRTAFAAYTTLGGGMDQLRETVKFDKKGLCTTSKFSCDYTFYGNTLVLKNKLLNAAGVDTKFTVERKYDEMYLTYNALEVLSDFSLGLTDKQLKSVERANIRFIFRHK